MTKNIKIRMAIFTVIIAFLVLNMFAPFELRDFETTNDNKNAFFNMNGVQQPLIINYGLSYKCDSKNYLFGFGGYSASIPDNNGSIFIQYFSEANKLQSLQVNELNIVIDGKPYDLPITDKQVEFDYFTGGNGNEDNYSYAYAFFNSPVIPQKTLALTFSGIITDKNGKTANFTYQSHGRIEKTVEIIPHWKNWQQLPEIFTYS